MSGTKAAVLGRCSCLVIVIQVSTLVMCLSLVAGGAGFCKEGLVSSTLFTFEDYGCEGESLHLQCPKSSRIIVAWAQYGRPAQAPSNICDPVTWRPKLRQSSGASRGPGSVSALMKSRNITGSNTGLAEDCLAPSSLEVVRQQCHRKRQCSVTVTSGTFRDDSCPLVSKYLILGYKCQPVKSHTAIACTGEEMRLKCPKDKLVAIDTAMYGYTQPGVQQCPNSTTYDAECTAQCSVQIVARRCHGKRTCSILASPDVFGQPCRSGTKEYLHVTYACAHSRTITSVTEDMFPYSVCQDDDIYTMTQNFRAGITTTIISTTAAGPEQSQTLGYSALGEIGSNILYSGFIAWKYIEDNKEQFILYIVVSLSVGLILVLLLIILRLSLTLYKYWRRLRNIPISSTGSSGIPFHPSQISPDITTESEGFHPSSPEIGRTSRASRPTPAVPESPILQHLPARDSPVFVHVESPRESPLLGRFPNGARLLFGPPAPRRDVDISQVVVHSPHERHDGSLEREAREGSPVWVRITDDERDSPPELPRGSGRPISDGYDNGSGWLPVSVTSADITPSVTAPPSTPVSQRSTLRRPGESPLPGLRPSGAQPSQVMTRSFSNPYRQDSYRIEQRRAQSSHPALFRKHFI